MSEKSKFKMIRSEVTQGEQQILASNVKFIKVRREITIKNSAFLSSRQWLLKSAHSLTSMLLVYDPPLLGQIYHCRGARSTWFDGTGQFEELIPGVFQNFSEVPSIAYSFSSH